jgi:amino acid transporter
MNEQNVSPKSFLITTCMAMGFMISPLSLVVLGNSAGMMGHWYLWTIPIVAIVNLWTAYCYARFPDESGSEAQKIHAKIDSKWVLTALQLASLVPFCIGVSTLILAMAGYALNEIFLYWFPNLLFSICFLILIVAVNFVNPSASGRLQIISVVIFMGSMMLLLIMGFFNWSEPVFENQSLQHVHHMDWRSLLLIFWLFMAAELAVYNDLVHQKQKSHILSHLMAAFVAAVAIFLLWGHISLHFVSSERLADSTVPHSIAARAISGENGRKIMGVAILAGSFASVNTLLAGVSAVIPSMVRSRQIFPVLNRKILGGNAPMMILSVGILCMLLTGMAGKDITVTVTRSAFYIWLISHAFFNVLAIRKLLHSNGKKNKRLTLPGYFAVMVYAVGAVVLIATDPDMTMALFFIVGFIVISILSMIFSRLYYINL